MKFWIEAILEDGDMPKTCKKCDKMLFVPDHIFCEFTLFRGNMPNPDDLHPEPTGKNLCLKCAKNSLV